MKKTIKKDLVQKAAELNDLITARKNMEKREKKLKEFFKTLLDDSNSIEVGSYLITLDDTTRTNLDKGLLSEYLGDKIKDFQTTNSYKKFNIKRVA